MFAKEKSIKILLIKHFRHAKHAYVTIILHNNKIKYAVIRAKSHIDPSSPTMSATKITSS